MKPISSRILSIIILIATNVLSQGAPGDSDNDGLRDVVETNTGVFLNATNTGTNPNLADSDGDSVPDGLEMNHGTNPTNPSSKRTRPNIILINCDDLGYGDIGCFWQNQKSGTQKFATPGLDAMAAQGTMLTHHYVGAPICASSRASLLQGRHQGHSDIRDKDFDKPLPNNHSIASLLKNSGYRTVHIGKAGLAGAGQVNLPAHPLLRGFDRFFGYYSHYTSQEQYPQNGTTSAKASLFSDYQKVTGAHVDLYTTDAFTGFAKKTIIEETQNNPNRPFFIYLAHTAPHFYNAIPPTQGYPAGYGVNGGIQWTGHPSYVSTATNDPNKINNIANQHPSVNPTWPKWAREHVSMIRRIDDSVTDILQTLRDLNIDQNTMVVFTVDNGCDDFEIDPRFFQGYANFEGKKTDMWEGGIRVPTIAWYPGKITGTNNLNNIAKNSRPSGNWDWLATFADFAGIPVPSYTDGVSIAPSLSGSGIQRDKGYLYFEFFYSDLTRAWFPNHGNAVMQQMQNIRLGDFMGTRRNILSPADNFAIYNVVTDPKQITNLASGRPDLQSKMKNLAISARRPGGGVTRPYDTTLISPVLVSPSRNGVNWKSYEGYWAWLPEYRDLTPASMGQSTDISLSVRSREADVGMSFEGYISVPTPGAYTFQTSSDAATSLWIHDGHVIDNDFNFSPTKTSTSVYLAAGLHPYRLYYRNQGQPPSLTLKYSGPGISMQRIPQSAFFVDGQPTILNPDTLTLKQGISANIDVLGNDLAEGSLTLTSAGPASYGLVTIADNRVHYSPNPGFLGVDRLDYRAMDSVAILPSYVTATVVMDNEIWFPLDEGTGTNVSQVGFGTGSGTITGQSTESTRWTRGKAGNALRFRGGSDIVTFQNLSLPLSKESRTVTLWVRSPTTPAPENQALLSYGTTAFGGRFTVRLTPDSANPSLQTVRVEVEGGIVTGKIRINDNLWHHVAVSAGDRDSNGIATMDEVKVHVDGVEDILRVDSPGLLLTQSAALTIGGSMHSASYNLTGDLDDLRIFPRFLTAIEVAFLKANPPKSVLASSSIEAPGDDTDGDGHDDDVEAIAGTDPNDSRSLPAIKSMAPSGSGFRLDWMGYAGRTYRVEESTDLKLWTFVPGVSSLNVETDLSLCSITLQGNGAAKRYFRLHISITPNPPETSSILQPMDQDGDGADDDAEFIAGTDPFDSTSRLNLRMSPPQGGRVFLTWDALSGRSYQLEESEDLNSWQKIPGIPPVVVDSPSPNLKRELIMGPGKRFLRLSVTRNN
jgi:arylsulfatase A-like enzyme